jgi:phosphate-selective porin O/P
VKADRVVDTTAPMFRGLLLLALTIALPSGALAGVKVAEQDDFTLELGMRLQTRMTYDGVTGSGGSTDGQRDFMIRRARLKANGKMLTATYGFEWKIDGTDQVGSTPSAAVENAWIQYPLGRGVEVRAGLYDQPYSRDRLTSDSRQLAVDRGNVSNVPDGLGLADNAVGFHVLGKAFKGRTGYALGLFDNRFISGPLQDRPMVVGRIDVNLGSTKDVYQDAHFGTDKWYSLGVNGSYQSIETAASSDSFNTRSAVGVDGMLDIPTAAGRVLVRGEFNTIRNDPAGPSVAIDTRVWMAGAGLLVLDDRLQPFIRFDEVRLDPAVGGAKTDITYVGLNLYRKGHSLKFQGDVRLQANTNEPVDGGRLQAQLDF